MSDRLLASTWRSRIAPDWAAALASLGDVIARIDDRLTAERAAGASHLPASDAVLRAFTLPLADVRVLLVGQDPYPTPGHPVGLSFAVARDVRPLPRSLANVYRELSDDLAVQPPAHGDLSAWADRGVLLLNRVLTVRAGEAGSHRGIGWEAVTDTAVAALAARGGPLAAVLWGRSAAALQPLLHRTPVVASAHPSPLSAARGFFGSRPFSRVNAALERQGAPPLDWSLPS